MLALTSLPQATAPSRASKVGSQQAPTFRFLSPGHGVTGPAEPRQDAVFTLTARKAAGLQGRRQLCVECARIPWAPASCKAAQSPAKHRELPKYRV